MNSEVIQYLLKMSYDYPDIRHLIIYIIEHPYKFESLIYQIRLKIAEELTNISILKYFNK